MSSKSQPETEIENLKPQLKIRETLRICEQAREAVVDLIRLAEEGDKLAVALLLMVADETVGTINSIAKSRPALILPYSRNVPFWVSFISRKRATKLSNDKLMDMLQLGEGGVYSTKEWQPLAPSTRAAFYLFITAQVQKNDWGLPRLTKETKSTWFERSWDEMLKEGLLPEAHPILAGLGKSAIGKKSTNRGMSQQTEGMKRDDVRAEIKRQVWNAFDRLIAGAEK